MYYIRIPRSPLPELEREGPVLPCRLWIPSPSPIFHPKQLKFRCWSHAPGGFLVFGWEFPSLSCPNFYNLPNVSSKQPSQTTSQKTAWLPDHLSGQI